MNILHGHSAAGTFRQALHVQSNEILVFTDELSCGPLTEFSGIEDWKDYRQRFWNKLDQDNTNEYGPYTFSDFQGDLYENFEKLGSSKEIMLWIGTGLGDQLLLIFLINIFDVLGLDPNILKIIQFESIPEKNFDIQALGILNQERIRNHPQAYIPSEKHITIAKAAWQAITRASPDAYLEFIHSDNNCLPLLSRALEYLTFRYPKSSNGLSFWDEKLLRHTETHGPNTARIIGFTLGECMDSLDLVGDLYLFSRLKMMGRPNLRYPLIEANALNLPLRDTKIKITETGKQALQGKVNVINLNGIDDWVGGVHLDSATGSVWMRKNETLFCQKL